MLTSTLYKNKKNSSLEFKQIRMRREIRKNTFDKQNTIKMLDIKG